MGGELEVRRLRREPRALGLSWGDALRWPLWQVGLVMVIYSLLSFPLDLATGQADGAWGTVSLLGPSGVLATLIQGPVGRYIFYSALASLLLASGAIVAAAGGLLCWWRVRPGRGFLAAGLLLALGGQMAGILEAMSQKQVLPETLSTSVAAAVFAAIGTGVMLAMVLLAAGGGAIGASHGPTRTMASLPKLGVLFLLFGAVQFLAAALAGPSDFSANTTVSLMPDPQLALAYAVLSLAAPAVLVVAGNIMWRGARWAPRLAALGWWGVVVQGLVLIVASWLVLVPAGAPPGSEVPGTAAVALAPGLFTSAFALLALWVQRAVGKQIWLPGQAGGPPRAQGGVVTQPG